MSGTLAIILGIIAAALIISGLAALLYNRRSAALGSQPAAARVRSPEEELSALGILEIKPREVSAKSSEEAVDSEVEVIEVEAGIDAETETKITVTEIAEAYEEAAEQPADESEEDEVEEEVDSEEEQVEEEPEEVDESSEEIVEQDQTVVEAGGNLKRAGVSRREALFRMLNAVQASVDGYTACLVKRGSDGRGHVEAIVSQNPQALGPKSLKIDDLLEGSTLSGTAVVVKDIDADAAVEDILGYYVASVGVRQVAVAPIKSPEDEDTYFLVVDALGWQDLDDPWQRLMIGQFATLLGTFMSTPLTEGEADEYIKPRVRPRREIIAEEIDRSRNAKQPLALALIYLNRAEEIAQEGGKAISDAERAMANRLELAVNGGRLERFGELTYGIFQDEGVSEVEAWALNLQEELVKEGEHFDGGVSIGIALLKDRHKDADDFRADAMDALREAFETGATTIIE